MIKHLVLLGSPGCGKGTVFQLLGENPGRRRSSVKVVSMSKVLNGGNPDGTLMDDTDVVKKLNAHLLSVGFNRSTRNNFLLEGVGRSGFQMAELIQFMEEHRQLSKTAFLKLNVSTQVAQKRMWKRYLENLETGNLRKEESLDQEATEKKFRGRIMEWLKTREAIFEKLEAAPNVFDINATQEPEDVVRDILNAVGWHTHHEMFLRSFSVAAISENGESSHRKEPASATVESVAVRA